MTEKHFTELYRQKELPQDYQGIEYILLLWAENDREYPLRPPDSHPFLLRFPKEKFIESHKKVFLGTQHTRAIHEIRLDGLSSSNIQVQVGNTMEELLEKAGETGPETSERNHRNPLFT